MLKVLIAYCDNNAPSQFICINSAYLSKFPHRTNSSGSVVVCPMAIYMAGSINCSCRSNYCTENYTSLRMP